MKKLYLLLLVSLSIYGIAYCQAESDEVQESEVEDITLRELLKPINVYNIKSKAEWQQTRKEQHIQWKNKRNELAKRFHERQNERRKNFYARQDRRRKNWHERRERQMERWIEKRHDENEKWHKRQGELESES